MTEDDDIGRINDLFVRGEISINEYIRRVETLARLSNNDDSKPKDQE